jgi:hypothetical protein
VRHVVSDDYFLETRLYNGYEEGLVEGVTRHILIERAEMRPSLGAYSHYAYAYRNLAFVLGVLPEALFHRLWQIPNGKLREWFPEVVDAILPERGASLSQAQTTRLRATADELFDTRNIGAEVVESALFTAWQEALR